MGKKLTKKELEAKISELNKKLKEKEKELNEHVDLIKRIKADFENYKKRVVKEQTRLLEVAAGNLVEKLLSVIDHLELALEAESKEAESLKKGITMVFAELKEILEKEGLKELDPLGERFDPLYHHALETIPGDDDEVVVEVLRKGYIFKGKLLRPAMVRVSKKVKGEERVEEK
jgi:molecular chaperone GrpE